MLSRQSLSISSAAHYYCLTAAAATKHVHHCEFISNNCGFQRRFSSSNTPPPTNDHSGYNLPPEVYENVPQPAFWQSITNWLQLRVNGFHRPRQSVLDNEAIQYKFKNLDLGGVGGAGAGDEATNALMMHSSNNLLLTKSDFGVYHHVLPIDTVQAVIDACHGLGVPFWVLCVSIPFVMKFALVAPFQVYRARQFQRLLPAMPAALTEFNGIRHLVQADPGQYRLEYRELKRKHGFNPYLAQQKHFQPFFFVQLPIHLTFYVAIQTMYASRTPLWANDAVATDIFHGFFQNLATNDYHEAYLLPLSTALMVFLCLRSMSTKMERRLGLAQSRNSEGAQSSLMGSSTAAQQSMNSQFGFIRFLNTGVRYTVPLILIPVSMHWSVGWNLYLVSNAAAYFIQSRLLADRYVREQLLSLESFEYEAEYLQQINAVNKYTMKNTKGTGVGISGGSMASHAISVNNAPNMFQNIRGRQQPHDAMMNDGGDNDGGGTDEHEHALLLSPIQQSMNTNNELYLDANPDKFLSKNELKEILAMTEEQYRQLLVSEFGDNEDGDEDGDGYEDRNDGEEDGDEQGPLSEAEIEEYMSEFRENKLRFQDNAQNFENLNWNLKMMSKPEAQQQTQIQRDGNGNNNNNNNNNLNVDEYNEIVFGSTDEMDKRRKLLRQQIGAHSTRHHLMEKYENNTTDADEGGIEKTQHNNDMEIDTNTEFKRQKIRKRKVD